MTRTTGDKPESHAPTPDFYSYPWRPIQSAEIDDEFVNLSWSDGTTLAVYHIWLKENAVQQGSVDPATRECTVDPASINFNVVTKAVDTSNGELRVAWSDGQEATYHPGWLYCVAQGLTKPSSFLPDQVVWTGSELREPPTHDATNLVDASGAIDPAASDALLGAWVHDMIKYGIARLRNLPVDLDTCLKVGEAIGAVRETNFGRTWDVKADIKLAGAADTNSTANTNLRLGPHTDLPTRETPPGFQFLYCYANEAKGGHSTMADGAAVVRDLKASHPDDYEALTTMNWIFFNRGPGIDHRWSGPIIDLGVDGAPMTLRAFYPVRAFPDMAADQIPRAYRAMARFSQLAAESKYEMSYPFKPGDLVGFDNRRILHGRDAFESGGYRHLRGIYLDHDEVHSYARVHNRCRALRDELAS